jgi:hypothetical protein
VAGDRARLLEVKVEDRTIDGVEKWTLRSAVMQAQASAH